MCVTAKELIRQAYETANGLPPATAELVKALASKLDVSMAATSQACEERNAATSELAQAKQHIAELETFRIAYLEWHTKTDWVQEDKRFNVLKPWGKHRADVLKAYIELLESRIEGIEK